MSHSTTERHPSERVANQLTNEEGQYVQPDFLRIQHGQRLCGTLVPDGSRISIDCTAVENAYADNMYKRSELDYLIYNDPEAYAELILVDNLKNYLRVVTEYSV